MNVTKQLVKSDRQRRRKKKIEKGVNMDRAGIKHHSPFTLVILRALFACTTLLAFISLSGKAKARRSDRD